MVTHDMHARVEHVGCADSTAKQAGLAIGLQVVDKDFFPPQLDGIGGNTAGKSAKQGLVLLIGAEPCSQGGDGPGSKLVEFFEVATGKPIANPAGQDISELG